MESALDSEGCADVHVARRSFVSCMCACFEDWGRELPYSRGKVSTHMWRQRGNIPVLALTVDLPVDIESRDIRQLRHIFAADLTAYAVAMMCTCGEIDLDKAPAVIELCRRAVGELHGRILAICFHMNSEAG